MLNTATRSFLAAALAGVSSLALSPSAALAQEPSALEEPQAEDGSAPGDIIVTARRREERLQDVPVSVTVLSAAQLQKYDMTSLEKISTQTPQFTIGRASNGSGAQLTLRGIGSSSTSIGIEQSVAVILDGVYYGQGRVINEGFLDLTGVEMLKGPQALYFGKNATAGVISLNTANPSSETEFMARAGYEFNAQQVIGEVMASAPLSDTLGVRVALRASNMFGGYFANGGTDKFYNTININTGVVTPHFAPALTSDNPGEREILGRITLQYRPDDRLTATLKANISINDNDNNSWNYVPFACAGETFSLNPAIRCGKQFTIFQNRFPENLAGTNPFSRADGSLYNRYRSWGVTGTLDYAFDAMTVTWINNFNRNVNQWACDCTLVSSNLAAAPSTERSIYWAFSSELRAQTDYDGPVNLLAGIYYQKTKRDHTQTGSFGNIEDDRAPPAFRYLGYFKRSETDGETISGYGQLLWKISDTLEATGGVRYTYETKDSFLVQPYVNRALQFLFPQDRPILADQTFNDWSPEATLTWMPNDDITVYGAFKTAYKSGGFSNSGFVSAGTIPSDVAFDPETALGFEAGVKTSLLDRQLRLNLGVYTYKYTDLQVDFFNSNTFAFITTNAGGARTRGVEVEFQYAPRSFDGFNLRGTLNYNHARYTDYIAPCYGGQSVAAGCNTVFQGAGGQDLSGAPTAVAPEWTGSLGFDYERPVAGDWVFAVSADSRYSSSYLASSFAHPLSRQDEFLTIDATLRLRTADERYEIAVIGRNLTNQFIVGGVVDAPNTPAVPGQVADQLGFVSLPRTVQIQGTVRF